MKPRTSPLGIELKKQRDLWGLKLVDLAKMADRSRGYLSQIELGQRKASRRLLEKIAAVLEINPNLLLRHINLLKMDFTRPAIHKEGRDVLAGLTPREVEEVLNYIDYLKYKRETQALESYPRAQAKGRY